MLAGIGFFAVARRHANRQASIAVLSFDPVAAQHDHQNQSALTLARSMIAEGAVRDLLLQTEAPSSDSNGAVSGFRSRLEMDQPSSRRVRIRYRGSTPENSAAITNAVAQWLTAWKPSVSDEEGPSAALPASVPISAGNDAPTATSRATSRRRALDSLSRKLESLQEQLRATDLRIDQLTRKAVPAPQPREAPAFPQSEQRRALEVQLAAAQKKLDDLRVRYTDEYPDVETAKDTVTEIQHELAALRAARVSANDAVQPAPSENHDAELTRLRAQKTDLADQIVAAQKRYEQLRRASSSHAAPINGRPYPAQIPSADSQQAAAAGLPSTWRNPFRIVHLAGSSARESMLPVGISALAAALFYGFVAACLYYGGGLIRRATLLRDDRSSAADLRTKQPAGRSPLQPMDSSKIPSWTESPSEAVASVSRVDSLTSPAENAPASNPDPGFGVMPEAPDVSGGRPQMSVGMAGVPLPEDLAEKIRSPEPFSAVDPEKLSLDSEGQPHTSPAQVHEPAAEWAEQLRSAIAHTWYGRLQAAMDIRHQDPHAASTEGSAAAMEPNLRDADSTIGPPSSQQRSNLREMKPEPPSAEDDGWWNHAERARRALASSDLKTAVEEMRIAVSMAPDGSREELRQIIKRLKLLA